MTQKKNKSFFLGKWMKCVWVKMIQTKALFEHVCLFWLCKKAKNKPLTSNKRKQNNNDMNASMHANIKHETVFFFGISLHYPREWRMTQSSVYGAYVHVFAIILVVDCVCTRARLLLLFWNQQLNECPHCSDMEKLFASMFFVLPVC